MCFWNSTQRETDLDSVESKYIALGRLHRAIKRAAKQHDVHGDALEVGQQPGTMREEFAALTILLDVPKEIRAAAPTLAHQMARAVVRTR